MDTIKKEPFDFTVSPADPCMLLKENNLGICIIIMYVDDMLIIGKKGANTTICNHDTKGSFSQNPAQPSGVLGLRISHEQRENKQIIGTTIYNQEPRTKLWQKINERKAVNDNWHTKIHCQKNRE